MSGDILISRRALVTGAVFLGFGRKAGSTETMGALLQRKKEVQAAITPAERAKPVILATTAATAAPPPVSKPQPKPDSILDMIER